MSLTVSATSGSNNFIQVPAGMHLARCYRIIDLGTQKTSYKGAEKLSPKVLFQFEIHSEDEAGSALITPDGRPLSMSKQYTLSLNENAILRRDLQSWRGKAFTDDELKAFDLQAVLGQWCMVSVVHDEYQGKNYSNIDNINPVPQAIKKSGLPQGVNETAIFSIRNADMALFGTFTDNIKKKIEGSPEWQSLKQSPSAPKAETSKQNDSFDDFEDDVPF